MKRIIEHEAILASAGSGKTFQLAHRYIRLLALGVEPNRIIAITFSRKASGEIFTSVVTHLRTAASTEEEARIMSGRIGCPDLKRADYLQILRRFLNDLQRLHISTIDSFTMGILRAFPMELGLAPSFDVANSDSVTAMQARAEALARIFIEERDQEEGQRDLLEAFKQATHGQESKSFAREFDRFIEEYQATYKLLPDAEAWGQPGRIWPKGGAWLTAPTDLPKAIERLRGHVRSGAWSDKARARWDEFLPELERYKAGMPWERMAYLADKLIEAARDLDRGQAVLTLFKKYPVEGPPAKWMFTIVRHLMRIVIQASLDTTQGIYRLLDRFEQLYDANIRRPGLITFEDALFLITRGGRVLSRAADDPSRLHIDYRLDSRLDHWLMDEFQDTSDLQWNVLRNLADEVLQDASGLRSFFFVGDVKQAIYGWRGGNHKLFGQVLDRYGARIHQRKLNTSFRSSQPVLDAVNAAFGALPEDMPGAVCDQWGAFWDTHTCREDAAPPPGYAAFIEAGEDRRDFEACHVACADLIREMDPLRRGLTVAVLARRNDTVKMLANTIRSVCPDMPVAIEGESDVADNPVVLLLLALVQYAAHPGDTLAREHLRMSPLRQAVFGAPCTPTTLLADIYRDGYQSFLGRWGDVLDQAHPLDDFGRHRLNALLDAAGEFDATGHRRPDDFTAFVREYTFPEQAADSSIRVMTIHKSKGLGFDIVILPDLAEGDGIMTIRDRGIHIARDEQGEPHWALWMPRKVVRQQDDVLNRADEQARHDGMFENLCALYVALTRAKRGLYMIATPPPKDPGALIFSTFLRLQLTGDRVARPAASLEAHGKRYGVIYERGERTWYEQVATPTAEREERRKPLPAKFPTKKSKRRRLLRVSPSSRAEEPRAAHLLFAPTVNRSLDFGTAVHGLFEQVEWANTCDVEQVVAAWRASGVEADEEAVAHFRAALKSPEFREALANPGGDVTLWREKPFEAVIDDEWITGTFDRVVIVRDGKGAWERAEILDFKTNDIKDKKDLERTVEHYRPQLALYAKALSRLTGLAESRIALKLLFTRTGRIVRL